MRNIVTTAVAILLWTSTQPSVQAENLLLWMDRMPVEQALNMYADATDGKLIVATQVRSLRPKITIPATEVESKKAMAKLIERALLEQTGVVVTELGNGRYSVTFNDALPAGGITNILNFTPPPRQSVELPPADANVPAFPTLPPPPRTPPKKQ